MNFALRIPDNYKKEIDDLKGGVSINQFIVNAVIEKIASLRTIDDLEKKSSMGSSKHGLEVLSKVAGRTPALYDKLD